MSQLSRPYQIALGALLVLALAWFTVLKPSDDAGAVEPLPGEAGGPAVTADAGGPKAPGQEGLTSAVDKAKGAVKTSDDGASATKSAAAAALDAAPTEAGSTPPVTTTAKDAPPATGPTGTTGAPAAAKADGDPSAPILDEVADGKVAVVLFSTREASDDRAVRRALTGADRHGGKVAVHPVSIDRVADYKAIAEGIDVTQAPTLLVIGKGNRARRIVGYTDTKGIDQLVADVGGADFVPRKFTGYRGRIENFCSIVGSSFGGNLLNGSDASERIGILHDDLVDSQRAVRKLKTPRRYRAHRRVFLELIDGLVEDSAALEQALASGKGVEAAVTRFAKRVEAKEGAVEAAARKAGLSKSCT